MRLFEKILCPVDFSEGSVRALQWSEYLAKEFHAKLHVLHVIDDYPNGAIIDVYEKYQQSVAERMQEFLSPLTIKSETTLSTGDPSKKISALAEGLGATVIVMGTRGLRGTVHKILGSTTENVLRHSSVPVMTISPSCGVPQPMDNPRLLVPFSTLQWPPAGYFRIKKILNELRADMTVLHVVDMKDAMFDSNFSANPFQVTTVEVADRKQRLLRIADRMIHHRETTEAVVSFGKAGEEIAKEIQNGKYQYALIGVRKKTLFYRFFESNVYQIISQSEIPVITFRVA